MEIRLLNTAINYAALIIRSLFLCRFGRYIIDIGLITLDCLILLKSGLKSKKLLHQNAHYIKIEFCTRTQISY